MSYVQGFVIPVPTAKKAAFRESAAKVAKIFLEYGAERVIETWGVDVPDGKTTDFKRAVKATADETVVFSWMIWPDKATCDAAGAKMQSDPRMQPTGDVPFDMHRMIYGGFEPLYDSDAA